LKSSSSATKTLKAEEVLNRPDDDAFATATVAVQIVQERSVGSVRAIASRFSRPGK
jgi:hypothetical protein